jgi:hypothetical protein
VSLLTEINLFIQFYTKGKAMYQSKQLLWVLSVLIGLLVAACAAGPTEFMVVDERELLGEVFTENTGNVDNSSGSEYLYQDLAVLREFRHRMDITFTPSGQSLNRQDVEERILDTYDLVDGSGDQTCLVPADVPPGNIYQFELEWTQIIREGRIEEGSVAGQGDILGTYTIVVDLQCQTVGVVVIR